MKLARRQVAMQKASFLLMKTHERAVTKIQQKVRGRRVRRLKGQTAAQDREAASRIQRIHRGKLARRELDAQKAAASATAAALKHKMFAGAIAALLNFRVEELPDEIEEVCCSDATPSRETPATVATR